MKKNISFRNNTNIILILYTKLYRPFRSQANGQQPYPVHRRTCHQRIQRLRNTVRIQTSNSKYYIINNNRGRRHAKRKYASACALKSSKICTKNMILPIWLLAIELNILHVNRPPNLISSYITPYDQHNKIIRKKSSNKRKNLKNISKKKKNAKCIIELHIWPCRYMN